MLVWTCLARLIAFDRCPLGVPCLSVQTTLQVRVTIVAGVMVM